MQHYMCIIIMHEVVYNVDMQAYIVVALLLDG
jgi:hypothetical protein